MIEKRNCYRREGRKVYIRTPYLEELSYTERLWGDMDSMTDVGKIISFPRYKWDSFYKKMVSPTDGRNLYCLVFDYDDNPVGEASFHGYDSMTKTARLNVRIENSHRGKGYGTEAVQLILECFFYEFGGLYMLDTVSLDGKRERLEKIGFKIMYKNKDGYSYRLSREDFTTNVKALKERKIGIFVYDQMVVSTVISFLEIFESINKTLNREIISVELVGTQKNIVNSGIYNINFENLKSIEDVDLDVIIVPGNKSNNFKENDDFNSLLMNINGCEIVFVLGNSIIPFIKNKFLRGLKTYYSQEWIEDIKEELALTTYSEEDIIDNGRLIMVKKKSLEVEGIKYIIKKLFGESILSKFDL
ncbi:GNAT family N-acetyltransferase [Clostridium sp. LIBA-8841]|uniref:GNAT family N-acetyltransferase n=1 Tax=Clostridium sp. LIBA-8841 TaxID=2987530 RepID=UPI002AC77187|nr:GNAT family N-acetyltransferase [Clostridium sp. LIBA-8841]MDZ5252912.1 GNAT family N-acetyltransferase [Clostridium sp. LIBA-8841]